VGRFGGGLVKPPSSLKSPEGGLFHPKIIFHGGSLLDLHPLNIEGGGIVKLGKHVLNLFNPKHWRDQKKIVRQNLSNTLPLTPQEKTKAYIAQESYKPHADRKDIGNYKYLKEHSGKDYAVYHDPETNSKVLSYRGTKPNQLRDLKADVYVATGTVKQSPRFKQALKLYDNLQQKLGSGNWETAGHSLGATLAMYVAQKKNINSHAFNPGFVDATDDDIKTNYNGHNVYVNKADLISNSILNRPMKNVKVLESTSLNPLTNHSISTFLGPEKPVVISTGLSSVP
jgi:hypothetical protein